MLCKTITASESLESHHMHLIWSLEDIQLAASATGISSDRPGCVVREPMLLQEFIDHGGVMFKVHVAGDWLRILARPSIMDTRPYPAQGNGSTDSLWNITDSL